MALASPNVVRFANAPRMGRALRRPQHSFQLRHKPWQIQPFMIAPVLPGETMKNLLMQCSVRTDPIKNRDIGWWAEHYFFYVKHRDLDDRDQFVEMMLDPSWTAAAVDSATDSVPLYYEGGTGSGTLYINWLEKCLKRIVEEYFRDEGDAWNNHLVGALPGAKVGGPTWMHSLQPEAAVTFTDVSVSTAGDNAFTMRELSDAERTYEWLRMNGAVDMTYEDFLRTYGVDIPKAEEAHVPELVRFTRNWQKPISAIDPTNGNAASAVNWTIAERADKDRFFKEPGFIVGVTCVRPKVYFSRQLSYAASMLNNGLSWLPAVMADDPTTSLKLLPDANGILGDIADAGGAWVDVKDLFLYGDQFVNFALTETDAGFVALPTAGLEKQFADETMANGLFVGATDATRMVRQEGLVSLNIAGRQQDTSS